MKSILIVEDSLSILNPLSQLLINKGFNSIKSSSILEAKNILEKQTVDLILLDISLSDGSGFDLCKYLKSVKNIKTPIIFLTAKDTEIDIVKGFGLGAIDYIVKPFKNMELIARINNALNIHNDITNVINIQNIKIDEDKKQVLVNDNKVELTALEYKILLLLCQNKNKVITRESILSKIWDLSGNFVNDNTLTVYIKRIRKKLGNDNIIKTIKSIGYVVEDV